MNAYQPVLDPASGGRMFWFDKSEFEYMPNHFFFTLQPKQTGTHWIVFMKEGSEH